jgi:eukaryotic-like serine/threonine-protein kinase
MPSTSAFPHPSPAAEADPLLGRIVNDRYRIVETIGQGGMGRVYKALQSPLDRTVALKILAAGHDRDPNFYKRFFLEASVTAKLTHPNTITLYDYGRTEDGIFFIAMEYLDGRTLSQTMQQDGVLAQERVIHVAQQICRSLREAHGLGIVHRDLKPANVMLLRQHDDHDFVKVLDFGLVKFFQGENPDGDITNAGTFMGSPHYIAPEQARNQGPDQRCDIYSLGVLLYQMLTGQVPFTAANPVDIILKHLHEAPAPLREVRPDLSIDPRLESIVLRCLAKERTDRFQTMDELLVALKIQRQQLAGGSAVVSSTPDELKRVAPRASAATQAAPPPSVDTPVAVSAAPPRAAAPPPPPREAAVRPPPPPPGALEEATPGGRSSLLRAVLPFARRPLWIGAGVAVFAALALTLVLSRRNRTVPATKVEPTAAAAIGAPPPPPVYQQASAGVTVVSLSSTPSGAEVSDADGRALGRTPLDVPVSAGKALQLTLTLAGYRPFPVVRKSLSGDRVVISATLKKEPTRSERKPEPPARSVGYKDDPY